MASKELKAILDDDNLRLYKERDELRKRYGENGDANSRATDAETAKMTGELVSSELLKNEKERFKQEEAQKNELMVKFEQLTDDLH